MTRGVRRPGPRGLASIGSGVHFVDADALLRVPVLRRIVAVGERIEERDDVPDLGFVERGPVTLRSIERRLGIDVLPIALRQIVERWLKRNPKGEDRNAHRRKQHLR